MHKLHFTGQAVQIVASASGSAVRYKHLATRGQLLLVEFSSGEKTRPSLPTNHSTAVQPSLLYCRLLRFVFLLEGVTTSS